MLSADAEHGHDVIFQIFAAAIPGDDGFALHSRSTGVQNYPRIMVRQ